MTEAGVKSEKVCILGSGFIGSSWAMLFIGAGYHVTMFDLEQAILDTAVQRISSSLKSLKEEGLLRTTLPIEKQVTLVSVTTDLATAIKGAFYIQECVFESVEVKKDIFSKLDQFIEPEAIAASSASVILPSLFTEQMTHRDQALIAHPVNPPFYCPLVEVLGSKWTKPELVDRTMALMKKLGQQPIRVNREIPGFALNRIQYAMLAECWRLIDDGIVSVEDCDKIIRDGLGLRFAFMGPFETTHLNAKGIREYSEKYNKGYLETVADMGPNPSWSGPLLDKIAAEMEQKIPLSDIGARIEWRNKRLAALAKLKKDMESKAE